jgi:hypothetical protein
MHDPDCGWIKAIRRARERIAYRYRHEPKRPTCVGGNVSYHRDCYHADECCGERVLSRPLLSWRLWHRTGIDDGPLRHIDPYRRWQAGIATGLFGPSSAEELAR